MRHIAVAYRYAFFVPSDVTGKTDTRWPGNRDKPLGSQWALIGTGPLALWLVRDQHFMATAFFFCGEVLLFSQVVLKTAYYTIKLYQPALVEYTQEKAKIVKAAKTQYCSDTIFLEVLEPDAGRNPYIMFYISNRHKNKC